MVFSLVNNIKRIILKKVKKQSFPIENVQIGKGTILNGKFRLVATKYSKIIIGKYCAIANGLKIITINHDYNYPAIQGTFYREFFNDIDHPGVTKEPPNKERTKGDVIIGNDVWIGEDVFITSGTKVGNGCCIAAKSVVTKDLESYSIYAGVPAKFIKKRFNEEVIKFLENQKWWDWSEKKIRANKKFFSTNLNDLKDLKKIEINFE